ncbi:unnamed protein product [Hymenolepis diminuta]|uniref:Uncharacterized protein n=1 Tax=Hymenolepis diminuta TaxID=6216 RepID=A0A564YTQ5_HYMDI|nr:unnamed protein product [Hymenolepis diminuta]
MIEKKYMYQHGLTHRVQREVEIHSRLKHPAILELYTCFEDANYVYLVLEVCDNGELQAYIRQNGPVSEDMARHCMKQIISGLLYLHSHKILHRDLTLANLLLTKDMKVKIADFGLATLIEPGEDHNTMCGTPNYISPEVASRGQQVLETDVWSLGIMLYTLVVGHPPFDTREVRSTLNRVLAGDYEMPSHLSSDCTDLISRLLRKQPQDRIKLADMIHHPFITRMNGGATPRHKMERSRDSGFDSITRTPTVVQHSIQPQDGINVSAASSSRHTLPLRPGANILPPLRPSSRISSLDAARRRLTTSGSLQHLLPPSKSMSGLSITSTNNSLTSTHSPCRSVSVGSLKPPQRPTPPLSPLSSRRLRPMRTVTRMAVINILADESVCLEFLEPSSPSQQLPTTKKQQLIIEVMGISPDGNEVVIYHPNGGRGVPVSSDSPVAAYEGDTCKVFKLAQLPEKYWKKYQFVSKFINMAKAHTPKVTLYTRLSKCILMERVEPQADFELELLADGSRVICLGGESAGTVQVITQANGTLTVNLKQPMDNLPSNVKDLITYAESCRHRCIEIESSLEKFNEAMSPLGPEIASPFPVIIGRRPNIAVTSIPPPGSLIPSSLCLSKLVANCRNTINTSDHQPHHRSTSRQCDPVFVPSVGWVSQPSPEELQVQFNDGARLVVVYSTATVHSIRYKPPLENSQEVEEQVYSTASSTNPLPQDVRSPEFTHKEARPWTPVNPPLDRFTRTKDIDIFEVLDSDDLRQFQSIVEEMGLIACSTFVDVLRSLSVKANDRQLTDFADLLRKWRSMQQMNTPPTISISSLIMDQKISFVRWKTHDEWVAKVKFVESDAVVISCCNHEANSVVIGRANGLTPPMRADSILDRRRRDLISSTTSNSSRTFLSRRAYSKTTSSITSTRYTSIFTAKKRDPFEQRVFKINKGVRVFEYSKEKNVLITGGMDRVIRIWNPYCTTSPIGKLLGHASALSFIRVNTEDNTIISVSSDSCIMVWDLDSQICQTTLSTKVCAKTHGDVQSCNYSPNTRSLVLVTDEACLVRFDPNQLTEERKWNEIHQSWEYFGGCLFRNSSQTNSSTTINTKPRIRVWNFNTGQLVSEITDAHQGEQITCMCFDLTEKRLITGGRDGYVRIWNHNSGACLKELEPKAKNGEGFIISAVECKIIGTGRYIVVVGWNSRISLYLDDPETFWDESNRELKQCFLPPWRHGEDISIGHQEDICTMAISRSSDLLATVDFTGEICVWNAVSGHVLKRLQQTDNRKGRNISGLVFLESREEKKDAVCLISCGPSDVIHFWSIHSDEPEFAAFHPSSMENVAPTRIAIGRIYEEENLFDSYLFTADEVGWIQVWNIRNYALSGPEINQPPKLYTWRCHTDSITGIEVINDRKLLVTTSSDFCARLWTWQGCFIGTFGQPSAWNIPQVISMATSQMGPFDVLVYPQTHIVPEYRNITGNIPQKNPDVPSSRRWGDVDFENYSKKLFGEISSKHKEINNIIENAIQNPEKLYTEAKISKADCSVSIKTGLSLKESHLRIFNKLLVSPLDPEIPIKRPQKYTDPELVAEDIEAAKLDEGMASPRLSFEQRNVSQQRPIF